MINRKFYAQHIFNVKQKYSLQIKFLGEDFEAIQHKTCCLRAANKAVLAYRRFGLYSD